MKIITINNTDYPFKVSYSVFKKAMTLIPDQEDMSEAALGTLEMVEKVGALAINQGLKSDGQNKRISSKDLVEIFDQDDETIAIIGSRSDNEVSHIVYKHHFWVGGTTLNNTAKMFFKPNFIYLE